MKKLLVLMMFSASFSVCKAQKIKFKKKQLLFDKVAVMNFEKGGGFGALSTTFIELETGKRVLMLVDNNNGTHMEVSDDYMTVKFLETGQKAELRVSSEKKVLKMLIDNGVLNTNGVLNQDKIELFVKNYDEKISDRTYRLR